MNGQGRAEATPPLTEEQLQELQSYDRQVNDAWRWKGFVEAALRGGIKIEEAVRFADTARDAEIRRFPAVDRARPHPHEQASEAPPAPGLTGTLSLTQMGRVWVSIVRDYCAFAGHDIPGHFDARPEEFQIGLLSAIDKHMDNYPNAQTPEESHNLWLAKHAQMGWVYGSCRNEEAKTHPCMVPYDELPNDQKLKDVLFIAFCRACAENLNPI